MRKFLEFIEKRNGKTVPFDEKKIEEAILKALKAAGGEDPPAARTITEKVVHNLKRKFGYDAPTVEQVQDMVEKELINAGLAECAKAYILYRNRRSETRTSQAFLHKVEDIISGYVSQSDWRVAENSNASYSLSGLQAHISGAVVAEYTLRNIYPKEISEAHRSGDFHIHDLGMGTFGGYCAGWSLRQLLELGFNGVPGRISAKPARHFNSALGQVVNFLGTMQNEWAGAQAFSSFDTYLAPLVAKDDLDYAAVKQALQEFVFAINATSRWGNQVPFTNITLDWVVPKDIANMPILYGGQYLEGETYAQFQPQMDMINRAFIEVMTGGDMHGRIFTFPIPTYNITRDFDWDSENARLLFEMTAKYGIPYFQNFVNSSLRPSDVRSMCCRLQLDLRELVSKTGGLFGSGEKTGSIGVVTVNLPRLGYLSKSEEEFFSRLDDLLYLAKESLEIKRKEVSRNMDAGL
ncbi:ribonucleoside triphosphate reductase, partial [Candidatus Saganbacteria bacterium]|nr:ribonucleoside triphosphate reductase [Candidatus Saganbacteria bacterium]